MIINTQSWTKCRETCSLHTFGASECIKAFTCPYCPQVATEQHCTHFNIDKDIVRPFDHQRAAYTHENKHSHGNQLYQVRKHQGVVQDCNSWFLYPLNKNSKQDNKTKNPRRKRECNIFGNTSRWVLILSHRGVRVNTQKIQSPEYKLGCKKQ